MKKFAIKITETLEKTVIVKAEDVPEALSLAEDNYYAAKDDYVLDAENFTNVNFEVVKE